jgi:tetratricopeptide (TPR) repeat protein
LSSTWDELDRAAAAAFAAGDLRAASTALERAVAIRPDHADHWFNLGYARRQLGDHRGALDAYATALANGLTGAEAAHVNRAVILAGPLGNAADAEAELQQAIALNGEFLPAWLNLGELHEDQGNAAAARRAYDRALHIAPGNGRAQARLAALTVLEGDAAAAVAALEARCHAGLAANDDALEILFAFGNALDAAGRHEDAFEAIVAANALSARLRQPGQRYDPAQMQQLTDALCRFSPPYQPAVQSDDAARALFICGMFRSGSTVLEQLVARHPRIAAGGELELIPAFVHTQLHPYPDRLKTVSDAELDGMRHAYTDTLASICPLSRFVTDKRPDNFLHIGLIKRLFPDAKIIVTRRAPLDNLLSIFFLNFADTVTYSDDLHHIVDYMRHYDRLIAHWVKLYPDDICFVDYEAVVTAPEPTLARIYTWLGLKPDDDAARLASSAAAVIRTPSNWQARGPLHHRSVGRWRNFEQPLAAYQQLLANLPGAET